MSVTSKLSERLFSFLRFTFGPAIMSRALKRRFIVRTMRTWLFCDGKLCTCPLFGERLPVCGSIEDLVVILKNGLLRPLKFFFGGIIKSRAPWLVSSNECSARSGTKETKALPHFRLCVFDEILSVFTSLIEQTSIVSRSQSISKPFGVVVDVGGVGGKIFSERDSNLTAKLARTSSSDSVTSMSHEVEVAGNDDFETKLLK